MATIFIKTPCIWNAIENKNPEVSNNTILGYVLESVFKSMRFEVYYR